jgi:NADH-quinone oxidoreductase subunit L
MTTPMKARWTMLVPLGVLAWARSSPGMIWYNSFFGKTDQVATFFGVEYVDTMAEAPWRRHAPMGRPCGRTGPTPAGRRPMTPLRLHQPAGRGRDPRAPGQHVLNEAHYVPSGSSSPFAR